MFWARKEEREQVDAGKMALISVGDPADMGGIIRIDLRMSGDVKPGSRLKGYVLATIHPLSADPSSSIRLQMVPWPTTIQRA